MDSNSIVEVPTIIEYSHAATDDSDNEVIQCRICLDHVRRSEVIAPCRCKGSSHWVHRACLDRWRASSNAAFKKCSVCLFDYKIKRVVSPAELYDTCSWRYWKFRFLIVRDYLMGLFVLQATIVGLGFLVYLYDSSKHLLLNLFHASAIPLDFYYLCGLFVFCFLVGLFFICSLYCCQGKSYGSNSCYDNYVFIYIPSGNGGESAGDSCCPCCTNCQGAHDLIVCGGQCIESSAHSVENCNCSGGSDEGALVCLGAIFLIAICVIAATGLVVSVVSGFLFMTSTLERHVGLLYRKQMVECLEVQDLRNEDLSEDTLGATQNPLNEDMERGEDVDDLECL